ncbi:SIS domain-containing protein [Enterococcus sp. BWB1-3]|uniref:SIS domain-containing protein n=1 Tax=unclassified Enterococcus TaxID=2608891 RepID=UPI0019232611|nr:MULTISPECIES: SIS domain-containing protein [unclassified Enterococcus]MBL1228265.1 SIS domain-containing protein [Enterococcus sp. BWB1-3]MCB5951489.1 SIS domain-containing protein [Enterococcus sp. BWT-B8]MCB5955048.1 SIS domain-containing protein [Enterococcus sp. CWB-B31]
MATIESYMLETPDRMEAIIENARELFSEVKKARIKRVIITGSGTSYHSGLQMSQKMRALLKMDVCAMYPFEITDTTFLADNEQTLVVGISQGGSSYSTYNTMKLAKHHGCMTASMAGVDEAFIDEVADYVLTVSCGEELAGAKTKGFYCTKLNLLLFALYIGLEKRTVSEEIFNREITEVREAIKHFRAVFDTSEIWIENHKDSLKEIRDIRITGPASLYGDILESALKLLETMRCPVTGYEFEEFIHGIYNAIDNESTVFILDIGNESRSDEMKRILSGWSKTIYLFTNYESENADLVLPTVNNKEMLTFNFIIPLQLMCAKIPVLRGIDPSIPKDPQFHMKLGSKKFNK